MPLARTATTLLVPLLVLACAASAAKLPDGYCSDDFVEDASAVARPPASSRDDNAILMAARSGSIASVNPAASPEARAYLERRLAPAAFFLAMFALACLSTCPVCTARLCCSKRCCAPNADKGAPSRTWRLGHSGAWALVACVSMAFVAVGIHFTRGISQTVSLSACEAVQLSADISGLVDDVNDKLDAFRDVGDVIKDTGELIGDRERLLTELDQIGTDLETLEDTVKAINISGAELSGQAEIADDIASARQALVDGRPTVADLDGVLGDASEALVDNGDEVEKVADSVKNFNIETPISEDDVEDFIVAEVIPIQDRAYASSISVFAYALCALVIGALSVALFVFKPAQRATPRGLNFAFSCEWPVVLFGLLVGGLIMIVPPLLSDVCEVVADFPANMREYKTASNAGGRAVDVLEGCFAEPPRSIAKSLDLDGSDADLDGLISFDTLDDIDLDSALDYDSFYAARDRVNALTWRDFGLNTTRIELIESCCDISNTCCGTCCASPETCDDTDLESGCTGATEVLEVNRSVESTLSDLQSDVADVDSSVSAFDASAKDALAALRSVEDLTGPVRDAIASLDDLGQCGFVADRYWGVHRALCVVGLPSIFWVAMGLCLSGALGIVLGSLLLAMAKMALVTALVGADSADDAQYDVDYDAANKS